MAARSRVRLLGLGLDPLTEQQVLDEVTDAWAAGRGGMVVTPNLDHLRLVLADGELADLYEDADVVVADGAPLLWAARLARKPLPERVAGADLLWSLSSRAGARGIPVVLVGGRPAAAERAGEALRAAIPGLVLAAVHCPPHGFEREPAMLAELDALLRQSGRTLVFLALGAPRQERLARDLLERHRGSWFVGVGAALDMAAGFVRRAPGPVQRAGLEWAWRLGWEPRRLARRYLVDDPPVAARLLASATRARWRRPR